jgi:hypothetical protein
MNTIITEMKPEEIKYVILKTDNSISLINCKDAETLSVDEEVVDYLEYDKYCKYFYKNNKLIKIRR